MIDYDYVELTSACITALASFRKAFPDHRIAEVGGAIERGARFVRSIQRKDGSWCGCCCAGCAWLWCCVHTRCGTGKACYSTLTILVVM